MLVFAGGAMAQEIGEIPPVSALEGNYIIMNSKVYEGVKNLADMRAMEISLTEDDSLLFSGYYVGSIKFKAGYNAKNGSISIPPGIKVFGYSDNEGASQYLYAWDDEKEEVIPRPIIYKYKGNNTWEIETTIVLMVGVEGGELSPGYFSQGSSKICRANATTENVSFVDRGAEQQRWDETRNSYVTIDGSKVSVFNMLQTDGNGYGCKLDLTYNPVTRRVSAPPALIGQVGDLDYPYRALTGCQYDDAKNEPTDIIYPGTSKEGFIEGTMDLEQGIIELQPMTIWPSAYTATGWTVDLTRFYEFVKTVKITFDPASTTSISAPQAADVAGKEIVRTEYYNLAGQRITEPIPYTVFIRRIYYMDNTFTTEKVYRK